MSKESATLTTDKGVDFTCEQVGFLMQTIRDGENSCKDNSRVHQACVATGESLCVNVSQGGTEGDTCFMLLAGSSSTKRRGLNPACSIYSTQFNSQICSICYCNGGYILLYLGQNPQTGRVNPNANCGLWAIMLCHVVHQL